jgi:hypothetical protein
LFPTVSKVDVQNTSTWRDSGGVVQLAFMCEHTVLRGETAMASKLDLHWVQGGPKFGRDRIGWRLGDGSSQ